ncbi:DUF885 domain-containing protein [Rhodospirillum centenum]|uniref:DUF885 domain-containing protein n=1 Tax=Rhodospirillum centenum (strain ATCC 51521 / SW) TaxID=414684 RepID=B6ITR4_RHOCS|nr:DUF885 domain-containing protein [Rhodospirillum centenum]ACI99365.1 conserved hypothetical protein [Rhodospirillum centenum SW]
MLTRRDVLRTGMLGGAAAVAVASLPWAGAAAAATEGAATGAAAGPSPALDLFFTEFDKGYVERRPQLETSLGLRYDRGDWDDISDEAAQREQALEQEAVARLEAAFDPATLSEQDRLSVELFRFRAQQNAEAFPWRLHAYTINHLYGAHTGLPAFLINQHRVVDAASAAAYVQRLKGIPAQFAAVERETLRRAEMGVLPPKFSLAKAVEDARSIIAGAPFDGSGEDSALWADAKAKLARARLPEAEHKALLTEAESALRDGVKPAYERLLALLASLEARAGTDDGVWKLPQGEDYYRACVRRHTTLPMTPDEVHEFGLSEVKRLHGELDAIRKATGFGGDLPAFLTYLRSDPRFFFPDTDAGREAYLTEARAAVAAMQGKLPLLFRTLPQAPVEVRRVEPFREKSSPPAFYNRPSRDGSRPGIYFINLATMRERPRHEIEAIAYHEAVPGHHMQNAIQQEADNLPIFRRIGGYTVFGEGWGLYAEKLGKEVGLYQDPYSDAGRLNNELWRAIRLVVDSGIHARRWTREQAADYMESNSMIPRESVEREINRYAVNPGQALAYKVGMRAIEDLRAKAAAKLGAAFDLRDFHELILVGGSMPLPILEQVVGRWTDARKA